jgi:phospholipid transport system substrate-binding protein
MRLRTTLMLSIIVLALALSLPAARALQAGDPSGLVSGLVGEAIANIKDKQEAAPDREVKFRALLEAGFDIPRISRFVLGRYWSGATDDQRQRFASLFEDWIVRSYSARFKDYGGQTIRVIGTRPESETSTVVTSEFSSPSGAPPIKVDWHVRKASEGEYKVVDVSIEGISMALTERDEIAAVADRHGGTAEGLNHALEDALANQSTTASK